jgi:hypothetical protein
MDSEEQSKQARERGGELGRFAGRFMKNAGPRTKRFIDENRPKVEKAIQDARPKIEKAVEDYRPRVEQAGRDAVRYAQEHEDELRGLALKGARARLGPLGMAIDALGISPQPSKPTTQLPACPSCRATNVPSAKFCTQCGTRLPESPPGQPS